MKITGGFKAFLILILMSFSVIPAFAQQVASIGDISQAAERTGDKSRQALVSIYGDVVNNPLATGSGGGDTILAAVFQITNGALLVVGAFFAMYIVFRKLTQTAHDGSVFDRDKHTLWGPIKLVWGLAAVVPTANGWSLSQLAMLWAASVMGVGVANLGVDSALSAFEDGKSMIVQPVMPSTLSISRTIFEANLCMHSVNAGLASAQENGVRISDDDYIQQVSLNNGFILKNKSYVCGGADLTTTILEAKANNDTSIDVTDLVNGHIEALGKMQTKLNADAKQFVMAYLEKAANNSGSLPVAEMFIQEAAREYENLLQAKVYRSQSEIADLASKMVDSIKDQGWWSIGSWYQTFAQANTKLSDAVAGKAMTFGPSLGGDQGITNLLHEVHAAYNAQTSAIQYTSTLGTQSSGDYSKGATGTDSNKIIGSIFQAPGQNFVNWAIDVNAGGEGRGQVNPLIKMKNLGDYTMVGAESALAVYAAASAAMEAKNGFSLVGVFSRGVNFFTSAGDVVEGIFKAIQPFLIMGIVGLLFFGAILSIYIPMVPFVIWFGAAINWLVVVGEAIIAAPLWALTHLGSDGDGMGHKTSHGYIFLLNVMVRPILMVIGFFLGGAGIVAGGTILNQFFGVTIANVQFNSMTGLISILVFIGVYTSMCLNLIHSCFNLIFIVPDQVINWVGGHASSSIGRDADDKANSAAVAMLGKLERSGSFGTSKSGDLKNKGTPSGNGIQKS